MRQLLGDRIEPHSAGIGTHGMNANAVRVMQEAGVDISGQSSKLVSLLGYQYLMISVCGLSEKLERWLAGLNTT